MTPDAVLDRLETLRLVLRPREPGDAAVYRALWTERDPRVPPHRRIDAHGRPGIDDLAEQIRAERRTGKPGILGVGLKAGGGIIGYCGLVVDDELPDEPQLAFELARSAHGHGYATEAGHAVVAWAAAAGYPRLRAEVWDWNVASRRVLQKLGFREAHRLEHPEPYGVSWMTVRELHPPTARERG